MIWTIWPQPLERKCHNVVFVTLNKFFFIWQTVAEVAKTQHLIMNCIRLQRSPVRNTNTRFVLKQRSFYVDVIYAISHRIVSIQNKISCINMLKVSEFIYKYYFYDIYLIKRRKNQCTLHTLVHLM